MVVKVLLGLVILLLCLPIWYSLEYRSGERVTKLLLNSTVGVRSACLHAPCAPTVLAEWVLPARGPWLDVASASAEPQRCNPYSGRCACLAAWGVQPPKECKGAATTTPVHLHIAPGWLRDLPAGLHRCRRSLCNVTHDAGAPPHAHVLSIVNASTEKHAAADGTSVLVGVALESRLKHPLHGAPSFPFFFHLGVSYARGHLDLQTTRNRFYQGQLLYQGPPLDERRGELLFVPGGERARDAPQARLAEELAALTPVDVQNASQSDVPVERLASTYKFVLVLEEARDADYVTEQLWRVLRAGAVPVYWGAPNVRDFLPHPDAAVLVDDYINASSTGSPDLGALAAYLAYASQHEAVYAKHTLWKRLLLPPPFVRRVVERPLDAVFCQVCDVVAERWGSSLGPIVRGGRGDAVVVPPCIAETLHGWTRVDGLIVRNWTRSAARRPAPPFKTYVISIPDVRERHDFMRAQLNRTGLAADLVLAHHRAEVTEATHRCWHPRSPWEARFHTRVHECHDRLGNGHLSTSIAHVVALWDVFRSGADAALLLEDDALFQGPADNVTSVLEDAIAQAPPGWDLIAVGTCFNMRAANFGLQQHSALLWRCSASCSRCSHAMLWSYEGAKKMLASLPLSCVIDFHINGVSPNLTSFWLEPPLALQASQTMALGSLLEHEREG